MRLAAAMLVAAAALSAVAFDSETWLGKREMLSREAERLRAAYSNCMSRATAPAEDVTIPVETFPDGTVKASVSAKKAMFFADSGFIWAQGVVASRFADDGTEITRIEADSCVIDRDTRSGWMEGPAKMTQGRTVFRGRNVYFSSPEGYVSIKEGSDIVSQDLRIGGLQ